MSGMFRTPSWIGNNVNPNKNSAEPPEHLLYRPVIQKWFYVHSFDVGAARSGQDDWIPNKDRMNDTLTMCQFLQGTSERKLELDSKNFIEL